MISGIAHALKNRLTLRQLLLYTVFLTAAYGVTASSDLLVALLIPLVIGEVIAALRETPSIDNRWVQVGIGAFVSVGSLAWLGYELTVGAGTGGPAWFPGLTLLAGIWFLFDARKDFADGLRRDQSDEMDASEVMLVMNHAHLVVEELRTGPKTVPELAQRCDLTESRVREALEVGTDDGMVYPVGAESSSGEQRYVLDESKIGGVAFVRSSARRIVRRLTRPFRG